MRLHAGDGGGKGELTFIGHENSDDPLGGFPVPEFRNLSLF